MACSPLLPPDRVRAAPLSHPLFWACLVVLGVNDHLLKGTDLLPGAVTGKLSDLAGLVVAPVLAAVLLGGRGRARRLAAMMLPVVPFVAINVSPVCAHVVEAVMGWRIWTDPTDLFALVMLPVAFLLVESARAPRRPWLDRAAVALGAVACVATSPPPATGGTWSTDAFVVNQAGALDLRVRWVTASIDCDRAESRVAEAFSRDAFGEGITFHLEQGDTVPLDRSGAVSAAGGDASLPPSTSTCEAVMLQVEGMPNTLAFWRRGGLRTVQPNIAVGVAPGDGAVVLQRVASEDGMPIGASTTDGIVSADLVERLEPEECIGAGTGSTFAWSESEQGTGTQRITSLDLGPDGCFALTLSDEGEELPSFFFVCVPPDAFPFEAGDTVEISHLVAVEGRSLRLSRAAGGGRPAVELVVYSGVTGIDTNGVQGTMVDTNCGGDRLDCGGFAVPGAFQLGTAGGDAPIVTGGSDELVVGDARVTVMVGRVERIVVAHPECTAGRDTLGIRGDVLVLTEENGS